MKRGILPIRSPLQEKRNRLVFDPELASRIGLSEAIVLQQLNYWLNGADTSTTQRDGRSWIYNTYKDWHGQFPFWSERTIQRHIRSLEDMGLILTRQWDAPKWEQRKYYTINYEAVNALEWNVAWQDEKQDGTVDHDKLARSSLTDRHDLPLTETTTKNIHGANAPDDLEDYYQRDLPAVIVEVKPKSKKARGEKESRPQSQTTTRIGQIYGEFYRRMMGKEVERPLWPRIMKTAKLLAESYTPEQFEQVCERFDATFWTDKGIAVTIEYLYRNMDAQLLLVNRKPKAYTPDFMQDYREVGRAT